MKTLRKQANSKLEDEHQLRLTKEKWLDKMRASEAPEDCAEGKED